MKACMQLIVVCMFFLAGCIGENYDYNPPTVKLLDSDNKLEKANIDWRGENNKPIKKETKDLASFAKKQNRLFVNPGQREEIYFERQDFAVRELTVSVLKGKEEINLDVKDRSFYFPKEKGEYVLKVDLSTNRGSAQYVGNLVIR